MSLAHPRVRAWRRRLRNAALARWYGLGQGVRCVFCGWQGRRFLPAGEPPHPNRLCPGCGSLERYRLTAHYLERSGLLREGQRILEMAPWPPLGAFCRAAPGVSYVSADLSSRAAMIRADLTHLGARSHAFDLVICLHVLEHVDDDRAAFRELRRVLRPGGVVLLMVPVRGEHTLERPTSSAEEREHLFGQRDHVRFYGLDLRERLGGAGFQAEVVDLRAFFDPPTLDAFGLWGDDRFLFRAS